MGITADFVVREFDEYKMLSAYISFLFYFVIGFVSSYEVSETKLCNSKNVILELQQESQRYFTSVIQEVCLCIWLTLSH